MIEELHVLFRVGAAEYALPARQVSQMESFAGVTRIPGAAPHVAGIVQVRGRVVPVIDLRVKFGLEATPATQDSRLVVTQIGDRQVALLVDGAREVIRLSPENVRPPPPMVVVQSRGIVRAIAQIGSRVVMLVDADGLVGEETLDGA
ncbi:MAG: chemotaxis protein CheW [Myxococcota bacterium]